MLLKDNFNSYKVNDKVNDTHKIFSLQGWAIESLQHWGQLTMLAAPGMLMLCTEWWSFEVGTFLVGE